LRYDIQSISDRKSEDLPMNCSMRHSEPKRSNAAETSAIAQGPILSPGQVAHPAQDAQAVEPVKCQENCLENDKVIKMRMMFVS